ncbi:MAG: 2-hydroxyglutaryl-CoA dehydratase [Planctomycetes bacterium]|nr:2-hydroxyglutaryl-CoA dehydratase [Planctomycetota bacterium]
MTPNDVVDSNLKLDAQQEAELARYEAQMRSELGLEADDTRQFTRPEERPFLKQTRESTTILFGGLTVAHDQLIQQAVRGLGYKVQPLDVPDNKALTIGKEFGNRGQCNPTYYTVGNLVKFLQDLKEKKGMTVQQIKEQYVFLTAGACGPCRFGMYEAEYRKALRDSGFDGFRVLLFEQSQGISQAAGDQPAEEGGIDYSKDFFMGLIKALMVGDLLNDMGYQLRPYEINKGETDRVLEEAKRISGDALREGDKIETALKDIRKMFAAVKCDFTRVKPKVKITGEFWAMTTEGDGNYKIGRWLEGEGAQVMVEPVSTWVDYLLYIAKHDIMKAWGLPDQNGKVSKARQLKSWALTGALKIYFRNKYDKYRKLLGHKPMALPDQGKIHKLAQQYYNIDLRGGEGHMEVGKNIYAVIAKKAHMVISVKPFGCMPSTQSDGVQSKVVNDYPECIFIPIETSGDGEVNVKSRVQMKLYEAKVRCREEFQRTLDSFGFTVQQFRDYVDKHAEFKDAFLEVPHEEVGTASNLVHKVAKAMKAQKAKDAKVAARMTVQEVERIAREQAMADGVVIKEAKEETHGHDHDHDDDHDHDHAHAEGGSCSSHAPKAEQSGECGDGGCPSCDDSLPGEQKDRSAAATVAAATAATKGEGSCGTSCGCS